jgi:hypothetical protein
LCAETEFRDERSRLAASRCPVAGCDQPVAYGEIACPSHWSLLPTSLRDLITMARRLSRTVPGDYGHWKTEAFRFWSTGEWHGPTT